MCFATLSLALQITYARHVNPSVAHCNQWNSLIPSPTSACQNGTGTDVGKISYSLARDLEPIYPPRSWGSMLNLCYTTVCCSYTSGLLLSGVALLCQWSHPNWETTWRKCSGDNDATLCRVGHACPPWTTYRYQSNVMHPIYWASAVLACDVFFGLILVIRTDNDWMVCLPFAMYVYINHEGVD